MPHLAKNEELHALQKLVERYPAQAVERRQDLLQKETLQSVSKTERALALMHWTSKQRIKEAVGAAPAKL